MLRTGAILLVISLAGCQPGSSLPAENVSDASAKENGGLQPGLYQVSGYESIVGLGTSPETRDTKCIGPDEAAHPDRFLVNPGNGCSPGELIISDHEMRREFRCNDGRILNFTVTFTSDSWDQSIIGTSTTGGYEARETARRVGDC